MKIKKSLIKARNQFVKAYLSGNSDGLVSYLEYYYQDLEMGDESWLRHIFNEKPLWIQIPTRYDFNKGKKVLLSKSYSKEIELDSHSFVEIIESLADDNKNGTLFTYLSVLFLAMRQYEKALSYAKGAISLVANKPNTDDYEGERITMFTALIRGICLIRLNKKDEAVIVLKKSPEWDIYSKILFTLYTLDL